MKIIIQRVNAAFDDDCNGETVRILKEIIKDIERTGEPKSSYNDINGNKVCFIE